MLYYACVRFRPDRLKLAVGSSADLPLLNLSDSDFAISFEGPKVTFLMSPNVIQSHPKIYDTW